MPIPRPTARVVILDENDRILLIKAADGEYRGSGQPVWLTPGGGLDGTETYEEAAAREVREEVGLIGVQLGPCVWTRRLLFAQSDGVLREKHERYFVCRVQHFEVAGIDQAVLDLEAVAGFRWWSLDEIVAATHEVFVPRAVGELLPPLIQGNYPVQPLQIGT